MMIRLAIHFRDYDGYTLRTGHAPGADQAFELGAGTMAEIYLPWPRFEADTPLCIGAKVYYKPKPSAFNIAGSFHPAWHRVTHGGRLLHARNAHQILGWDLKTPVEFVVCWTPSGKGGGGTNQAIRIAKHYDIPVYDLAIEKDWRIAMSIVEDKYS